MPAAFAIAAMLGGKKAVSGEEVAQGRLIRSVPCLSTSDVLSRHVVQQHGQGPPGMGRPRKTVWSVELALALWKT
jgi:hypothetical protein